MTEELKQLREALRRVKYEAASLADAQVIALEALTAAQPAQAGEREADDCDVTGQHGPLPETGWDEAPPEAFRKPSPTAGMNLGQRIKHVGGRENAAGYIEFGSVAAVRALVRQYLRDLPTQPAAHATPEPVGEPALWVLTKQLDQRETTTRGYLWFSNPQNDLWTPLYTRPAPGVPDDLATIAGLHTSVGHLSRLIDEQTMLLARAMQAMKKLHESASPDDGPDLNAIIPAGAFHEFVDDNAALRYAIAQSPISIDAATAILAAPQAKGGDHG